MYRPVVQVSGTYIALCGHDVLAMEYADLPGETWAEVHYLAKRKQRHPDAEVARAAYEWASDVRAERTGTWLSAGLIAALEGLLGGTGVAGGSRLGEWWKARRVWRLGPPPTTVG